MRGPRAPAIHGSSAGASPVSCCWRGRLNRAAICVVAAASFAERCVAGLHADRDRIADLLARSLMLVTALAPHIGYDAAARIAKTAHAEGGSLRDTAIRLGLVTPSDFDPWVRPESMLGRDR